MRHVQEHGAQLSLFLGQKVGSAPGWVSGMGKRRIKSGAKRAAHETILSSATT
jgi:hypothetical protein